MSNKKKTSNVSNDVNKQLNSMYKQIEQLVAQYNNLSSDNKLVTRVGCIITPSQDEDYEEDEYSYQDDDYSYSGWMPSSLGC